jgi:hypothetical protein
MAQIIPIQRAPAVLSPRMVQALSDANFAARVYRDLGAKVINVDMTPALHGEKPKLLVYAPASVNPPSFGRVEVTRQLPNIH